MVALLITADTSELARSNGTHAPNALQSPAGLQPGDQKSSTSSCIDERNEQGQQQPDVVDWVVSWLDTLLIRCGG